MAQDLGDLNAFLVPGMTFSWDSKPYRIPPVSAALGLWGKKVASMQDGTREAVAAAAAEIGPPPIPEGQTEEEAFLSPGLVKQLIADEVPWEVISHLAETVYAQIVGGDKFAVAVFEGNLRGPTNREERRAAKKATPKKASSSRTTSTDTAATTPKPDSGRATKSQPTKSAKAAPASRGAKSSNAGRA